MSITQAVDSIMEAVDEQIGDLTPQEARDVINEVVDQLGGLLVGLADDGEGAER